MYIDYMQNLLGGNPYPYQDTYEQMSRNNTNYNQINECGQYNYGIDYDPNSPYMNITNCSCNPIPYNYMPNYTSRNLVSEMEELYPEIYKLIYPMIKKACSQMNRVLNEELLENMTDEIYNNIESNNIISLNVNIGNQSTENNRNVNTITSLANNKTANISQTKDLEKQDQKENRQFNNNTIRDLIKILLIRELVDRPNNRPPRPFPPRPMPPMPPRPRF